MVEMQGARVTEVAVGDSEAYLVEPEGGGRGPAVLFLHWFDSEAPDGNRSQFLDEAVALARTRGSVSVLPQGRFPWAEDPVDADHDTRAIGEEVTRHRLALDLLSSRKDVDRGAIAIVGHDFGGMHGVLAAAEDERVGAVVVIAVTPRWGDWFLPFWKIGSDRHDYLRTLAPLDPVSRIGEVSPRPVLFQFAERDYYIATMAAHELVRTCGEPKDVRFYESDHAMRHPQAVADRAAFLEAHFG